MDANEIDRHIRTYQRCTTLEPQRQETPDDKVLRELAWILRGKIQRRCAPFVPPRPRSSFRLIP